MTIHIRFCARCGGDHERQESEEKKFVNPVVDWDGTTWTHWWTCPTTGDPVLIREAQESTEGYSADQGDPNSDGIERDYRKS